MILPQIRNCQEGCRIASDEYFYELRCKMKNIGNSQYYITCIYTSSSLKLSKWDNCYVTSDCVYLRGVKMRSFLMDMICKYVELSLMNCEQR